MDSSTLQVRLVKCAMIATQSFDGYFTAYLRALRA